MSRFMTILESAIRDTYKNKSYFDQYIKEQRARIDTKLVKLQDASGDRKQKILMSLIGYYIDLLKAEYSNGASKATMKALLVEALKNIEDYKNATYDDLLVLLSLNVMLDTQSSIKKLVASNKSTIAKDRLLTYLEDGGKNWNGGIPLNQHYKLLDDVFTGDPESSMETYVKNWYESNSDSAWYNRHMSDTNTYSGYWCFEAAAIVKLLHISDSKLTKYSTYPKM